MRRGTIERGIAVVLICGLALGWLKEVSERRARRAADEFLGPYLERYEWVGESLYWDKRVMTDMGSPLNKGCPLIWAVSYQGRIGLDDNPLLSVDLWGNVRGGTTREVVRLARLPAEVRRKEILEMWRSERREPVDDGGAGR